MFWQLGRAVHCGFRDVTPRRRLEPVVWELLSLVVSLYSTPYGGTIVILLGYNQFGPPTRGNNPHPPAKPKSSSRINISYGTVYTTFATPSN